MCIQKTRFKCIFPYKCPWITWPKWVDWNICTLVSAKICETFYLLVECVIVSYALLVCLCSMISEHSFYSLPPLSVEIREDSSRKLLKNTFSNLTLKLRVTYQSLAILLPIIHICAAGQSFQSFYHYPYCFLLFLTWWSGSKSTCLCLSSYSSLGTCFLSIWVIIIATM